MKYALKTQYDCLHAEVLKLLKEKKKVKFKFIFMLKISCKLLVKFNLLKYFHCLSNYGLILCQCHNLAIIDLIIITISDDFLFCLEEYMSHPQKK